MNGGGEKTKKFSDRCWPRPKKERGRTRPPISKLSALPPAQCQSASGIRAPSRQENYNQKKKGEREDSKLCP